MDRPPRGAAWVREEVADLVDFEECDHDLNVPLIAAVLDPLKEVGHGHVDI
jgi:hypothetical protein